MQKIKVVFKTLNPSLRLGLQVYGGPLLKLYYSYLYRPKVGSLAYFLDQYSKASGSDFTVVQIGANDGMIHDPINKFIKRDSWRGLLLEPQQSIHDQYLQKVYARQHGIHTLCAAVGAENGYSTLYKIGWCDMRWASGLATFQKAVLQKGYDSGLVERASRKYGLSIPKDNSTHIVEEQVRVVTPTTLLEEYQITSMSLLMIDTEGYDYEVIKLFNIANTRPRAIIYENIHLSKEDRKACGEYLHNLGYHIIHYDANTVAILQHLWEGMSSLMVA